MMVYLVRDSVTNEVAGICKTREIAHSNFPSEKGGKSYWTQERHLIENMWTDEVRSVYNKNVLGTPGVTE